MAVTVNIRMKQRRKAAADWTSTNEVLLAGEMGLETDTRKFKFGDGTTAWNSLSYPPTDLTGALLTGQLDTDGTLAANSDAKVASQKAVKTYVDNAVTGLLDFKGATDCSSNPNYPAALKGDAYVVSVAGKIGGGAGGSVDIGDVFVASADNAGGTQAAVGSSWFILEHNLAGALLAANNLSDLANAASARTNLGLGNVDNTSDANKPVSTAQLTALNLKANLASPSFTGIVGLGTSASFSAATGVKINLFAGLNYDIGVQAGLFQFILPSTGNAFGFGVGSSGSFTEWMRVVDGNLGLGTTTEFGGGTKVIALANATTVPTTNPTGGGVLYAEGGALKWRGSSGTVTTIAVA